MKAHWVQEVCKACWLEHSASQPFYRNSWKYLWWSLCSAYWFPLWPCVSPLYRLYVGLGGIASIIHAIGSTRMNITDILPLLACGSSSVIYSRRSYTPAYATRALGWTHPMLGWLYTGYFSSFLNSKIIHLSWSSLERSGLFRSALSSEWPNFAYLYHPRCNMLCGPVWVYASVWDIHSKLRFLKLRIPLHL